MEKKELIIASSVVLGFTMQELFEQGWKIDPEKPLVMSGFQYEVGFSREFDADRIDPPPKLTPAQRMAKARAAKGKKEVVA